MNSTVTSKRTASEDRVLVAGATGYLGGFVVRELKRRGYLVHALARAPGKPECVQESVDEVVKGDVTRPEPLDRACEGIDAVFSSVSITRLRDGLTFRDVDVGGPQTMPWSEVAALAFEALGKPVKISRIPGWLMWGVVSLVRFFNRHQGELLALFTTKATTDEVAPATGTRTLSAHYRAMRG